MDFMESTREKLVPMSPRALVERLAYQWRGKPWTPPHGRPLVTVLTADNFSAQGFVVDVKESGSERSLLFKMEAHHSPYQNELVYLSLDRVVAVVVHGAEKFSDVLTGGAVARPRKTPAPSSLELKRLAQATAEKLKIQVVFSEGSEAIPAGDGARGNAGDLLAALPTAFQRLGADETGKRALAGVKTLSLVHAPGTDAAVTKTKDRLRFAADFEAAFPEDVATWLETTFARAL